MIDNGSTQIFIQLEVAYFSGLMIAPLCYLCSTFQVYLVCQSKHPIVLLKLQGLDFIVKPFVLPIKGLEIVIGVPWLQLLGLV